MNQDQQTKLLDEVTWRRAIVDQVAAEADSHSRRHWSRCPVTGEVKAEFSVNGELRKRSWDLLQVSVGGLTVRTGEEIAADTPVDLRVQLNDELLFCKGATCHCTQTVGGFKVGIRLIFEVS